MAIDWAARFALPQEFYDGRDRDAQGPWWSLETAPEIARALEHQLVVELPRRHVLAGHSCIAKARRQDNDDVLFQVADGRFAIVHLGWSEGRSRHVEWPVTTFYDSWEAVQAQIASDEWMFRPK